VKYLSKFEIGEVISLTLVREPDEQDIKVVEEKNEDQLMTDSSWSFDD
jgi:hypothetical protein